MPRVLPPVSLSGVLTGLAVLTVITLSACSGTAPTSATPTDARSAGAPSSAAGSGSGGSGASGRPGAPGQPGVSGLIADVSGSTMQVQSATKQTAVTWSAATRFTQNVSGSVADITVGSCVLARAATAGQTGAP
ncbi:MAG: hypothetical protein WAR57_05385, partial [Candidatus Phosphoribacter sp.]